MPNFQRGFAPIYLLIGLVVLMLVGGIYFYGRTTYLKLNCPYGIVVNNECGWNWAPPPTPTIAPKTDGTVKYTCPENGYQNCMPILDAEGQKQCSKEALDWKAANCPNFSGAAY